MEDMSEDGMFRDLTNKEAQEYRDWARTYYEVHTYIPSIWHPIVRDECERMNDEIPKEIDNFLDNDEE
jgi:hypothetical protein